MASAEGRRSGGSEGPQHASILRSTDTTVGGLKVFLTAFVALAAEAKSRD